MRIPNAPPQHCATTIVGNLSTHIRWVELARWNAFPRHYIFYGASMRKQMCIDYSWSSIVSRRERRSLVSCHVQQNNPCQMWYTSEIYIHYHRHICIYHATSRNMLWVIYKVDFPYYFIRPNLVLHNYPCENQIFYYGTAECNIVLYRRKDVISKTQYWSSST